MAYPSYQRQPFGAKDYSSLAMLAGNIDEAEQNQLRNEMAALSKNQELQEKAFTRSTLQSLADVMGKPDVTADEAKKAMAKTTIDLLGYGGQHAGNAASVLSKLSPFDQEDVLLGSDDIKGPGGQLDRVYKFGQKTPTGERIHKLQPVTMRPGLSMMERLALIDAQNKGKLDVEAMRGRNRASIQEALWNFNLGKRTTSDMEQEFKQIQTNRESIKKELQQLKSNLIPLPNDADKDSYIYQRWLEGENMRQRANALAQHLKQSELPAEPPPLGDEKMKEMEQKYGGPTGTKFRTPDYPPVAGDTLDDLFK